MLSAKKKIRLTNQHANDNITKNEDISIETMNVLMNEIENESNDTKTNENSADNARKFISKPIYFVHIYTKYKSKL